MSGVIWVKPKKKGMVHLQGIGEVPGIQAKKLKPGDITIWNGGGKEKIISVTPSKTGKSVNAVIEYVDYKGKKVRSTRQFRSDTLIGIDK